MYVLSRCPCLALVFAISASAVQGRDESVLGKIKSGLKYASDYLKTAREIADLVSASLGRGKEGKRGDEGDESRDKLGSTGLISTFFRLLGLDTRKIGAIAVNSAIFLAQMISSLFDLKPQFGQARSVDSDDPPPWDPLKFILDSKNERIQRLIEQAEDAELPDQLINRVDGLDTSCIRLLICKTSPIIRAAQKSLKNETRGDRLEITSWLPSKEEFEENSDSCEDRFTECELFQES